MKAKDLIGKVCTRTSPAIYENGNIDRSYMGDKILIVNANNYMISYICFDDTCLGKDIRFLPSSFCDDNWENIEQFLKETAANAKKFTEING